MSTAQSGHRRRSRTLPVCSDVRAAMTPRISPADATTDAATSMPSTIHARRCSHGERRLNAQTTTVTMMLQASRVESPWGPLPSRRASTTRVSISDRLRSPGWSRRRAPITPAVVSAATATSMSGQVGASAAASAAAPRSDHQGADAAIQVTARAAAATTTVSTTAFPVGRKPASAASSPLNSATPNSGRSRANGSGSAGRLVGASSFPVGCGGPGAPTTGVEGGASSVVLTGETVRSGRRSCRARPGRRIRKCGVVRPISSS